MTNTDYYHIGIKIINERYETISSYDGNFADVFNEIIRDAEEHIVDESRFTYLSGIDPYDNTFFNFIQIPKLIKELIVIKEESTIDNLRSNVDSVITYLGQVKSLNYAKFIGD